MNVVAALQERFRTALGGLVADPTDLVAMIRPSQSAQFGDYQANCAMPLGKQLGRPPRDVAADIVARASVDDLCHPPQIAGPGFINLKLRDEWLARQLQAALADERLGVETAAPSKTFIVDYSAPNVAKPMHVGHIRSTVIGDALLRVLRFTGHRAIGDNHIGDWGTQFGMIIYGYKHFVDAAAYRGRPVEELGRLYRLVRQLVDYHEGRARLGEAESKVAACEQAVAAAQAQAARSSAGKDEKAAKNDAKSLRRAESALAEARSDLAALARQLASVENDPALAALALAHADIGAAVLAETAKLHAGDAENRRLWDEFLPQCLADIDVIYRRLGVTFDHTLGESFYQPQLARIVADLLARGLARTTAGAIGVFLAGHDVPMLIRKADGAFLYATSDLATIEYRLQQWRPDAILYVVDHRQSLHFAQLFAAARKWIASNVELVHVSFGTVLGHDGRPFKTRSGDTVGLVALLDEAVRRAYEIVGASDESKPGGAELSPEVRRHIAEVVGIGALKYADLSQNRTSDYVFDYDKMLAMDGNTATYMQYAYARVRGIFAKGGIDPATVRAAAAPLVLAHPAERALGLGILQLSEALEQVVADYRPNFLTAYLYELAGRYSAFFENCPVLKAETDESRHTRLALCDLTARTLKLGLALLGIDVVDKM